MYCPKCESSNLIRHGKQLRLTRGGRVRKVQRYRCKSCGRFTVYPSHIPPSVERAEIEGERRG